MKEGVFIDCNEAIVKMFKAPDKATLVNVTLADVSPEFQPDEQSSLEKMRSIHAFVAENDAHKF